MAQKKLVNGLRTTLTKDKQTKHIMYRTKTCGELRISDAGKEVTLAGWVQRTRKMGGMTFVDIRDRYGITQIVFNEETDKELCDKANKLGREYVVQIVGKVNERYNKNPKMPTGDIEIIASKLKKPHHIRLLSGCPYYPSFTSWFHMLLLCTLTPRHAS